MADRLSVDAADQIAQALADAGEAAKDAGQAERYADLLDALALVPHRIEGFPKAARAKARRIRRLAEALAVAMDERLPADRG